MRSIYKKITIYYLLFLTLIFSCLLFGCSNKDVTINLVINNKTTPLRLSSNIITLNDLPENENLEYLGLYLDENYNYEFNGNCSNNMVLYVKAEEKKYNLNDILKIIRNDKNNINDVRIISFRSDISGLDLFIFFENHLKEALDLLNVEFYEAESSVSYVYTSIPNKLTQEIRIYFTNLDKDLYYFDNVLYMEPDGTLFFKTLSKNYISVDKVDYDKILTKLRMFYETEMEIRTPYHWKYHWK